MAEEDLERAKLRLEEERLALEKAKWEYEKTSSRRHLAPLLGILGTIIAGLFTMAQVWVATIQRDQEMQSAKLQREQEWKFQMVEFVFNNREAIFSSEDDPEKRRILKLIAVAFPQDIAATLFGNLANTAASPEQKQAYEEGQQFVASVGLRMSELEDGIDRFGADYKDFQASDVAECAETCLKESTCRAFSFNKNARQCWLKNAVSLRRENSSFVSSVKLGF